MDKLRIVISICCIPVLCLGQINTDSLWKEYLEGEYHDTIMLSLIDDLATYYANVEADTGLLCSRAFLQRAQELQDHESFCRALNVIGASFTLAGEFDSCIHYFNQSIKKAQEHQFKGHELTTLTNLGVIQYVVGDDAIAIATLERALSLANELNDKYYKLTLQTQLGDLLRDYDLDKAGEYYHQNEPLALKHGEPYDKLMNYFGLTAYYVDKERYDSACLYAYKSLDTARYHNMISEEVYIFYMLGTTYKHMEKPDSADYYLDMALAMINNDRDNFYMYEVLSAVLTEKGELAIGRSEYKAAKDYCSEAYDAELEIGRSAYMAVACNCLSKANQGLGNFSAAYKYLQEAREYEDELRETENIQKVIRKEMNIAFQQKSMEDSIAAAEQRATLQAAVEAKSRENKIITLSSVVGVLMVLGFLAFAINRYKKVSEQNIMIEHQRLLLQKDYLQLKEFTENASHEMQTPMAIIHGKLESLMQTENISEEQMRHVQNIYTATYRMSVMNRSLLLLAKIENNQFSERKEINLSEQVKEMLEEFEELFADKNLKVKSEITPGIIKTANEFLTSTIFYNLLKNAISHNIEQGEINVKLTAQGLTVENTGKELKVDPVTLFDRFKKASGSEESTGLGLAIVKKSCEAQHWLINYVYNNKRHELSIDF